MSNSPNGSEFTINLPQCQPYSEANADLSSLYRPSSIQLEQVECIDETYRLYARCSLPFGECPYCGSRSRHVHSRYTRTISDLSILGHRVIITFESRKFFCTNPECRRKTFAEQPGDEIFRYRRRTRRCEMLVTQHGLKCSSESARKLLHATGINVSGDTVLRDLHRMSIPEHAQVRDVGVDDWAYRKGVKYGSIIVSMETGEVIDLLGDREAESFQQWLDKHREVKLVSRDRSTDYSAAIAATERDITEVADRFYLTKNMSDCVVKIIGSHYDDCRKSMRHDHETNVTDSRQTMFNEVKELQSSGHNIAQISKELGIARQTVRKYMGWESLPKRASKERHPYYLYDSYVEEEYKHGKDLHKIFLELKNKGFQGATTPFYDHYRYLSDGHKGYRSKADVEKMKGTKVEKREPLLPIRQIAGIVDKSIRRKGMTSEEQSLIEKLQSFGWFRDTYNAASAFYSAIMGDDKSALKIWLDSYGQSPISELKSFAYGIKMDIKAVNNAIDLDTSNGIVEGYVNKLKAVKRVMYGRASVELLRNKMVFSRLGFN